ncbi:MAG: hypothetical protein K2K68_06115 [Duncaniella sp.]|nr:hypothetical protein [Duncaniella sp.]
MNYLFKIAFGIFLTGFTSCSNSSQQSKENVETDSVSATETYVEIEEAPDNNFEQLQAAARKIMSLALNIGQNSDDFEKSVIAECTSSFIKALENENEFDDGGLPWYVLRTMEQEGPEFQSSIVSITAEGDNAVVVEYLDMGLKGKTKLEFVKDGDTYKVNSASVTYKEEIRTIK